MEEQCGFALRVARLLEVERVLGAHVQKAGPVGLDLGVEPVAWLAHPKGQRARGRGVRRGAGHVSSGPVQVSESAITDLRPDLTALVRGARRGLRRDVAALEAGLDDAELFVPLM